MSTKRRSICFVCFIITLSFTGCMAPQAETGNENLDAWIGKYSFSEFAPPNINMQYDIEVLKENEEYHAIIEVNGFQTMERLKTKVSGNEKKIDLIFKQYLPDHGYEPYSQGDILLSFQCKGAIFITEWNSLKSVLPENKIANRVCFLKE